MFGDRRFFLYTALAKRESAEDRLCVDTTICSCTNREIVRRRDDFIYPDQKKKKKYFKRAGTRCCTTNRELKKYRSQSLTGPTERMKTQFDYSALTTSWRERAERQRQRRMKDTNTH